MRLLFLHGAGLTAAMWRPQLDALAGAFDVDAIDLPGHGERHDERFSFPAAVEAIVAAVPAGAATVLIGLSLGGYSAQATAAAHPDLAAGLLLTGASVDYSRFGHRFVAHTGELFQRAWPKSMLKNAQDAAFRKRYPDYADELVEAGQWWRGYADALKAARRIHWSQQLESYERPVLLLNGVRDTGHSRAAAALAPELPHARVQVIDDAGHLANLDQPEAYTEAVRGFAGSLRADRP
jgi:pimeloyl-ACP methyl ester carboxylesterase